MAPELVLPVLSGDGRPVAELEIRARDPAARDALGEGHLVEGHVYLYRVRTAAAEASWLQPAEFFDADDETRLSGRLQPREHVGTARVEVGVGGPLGAAHVEVVSRKLEYASEFVWMVRDLAEAAAEALLQGFAPTAQAFDADASAEAETLYRRFAYLLAKLNDPDLRAALAIIVERPHRAWSATEEVRRPGQPLHGSGALGRTLAAPGPRVAWEGAPAGLESTLPRRLATTRYETSYDTVPNQFVKATLMRWRELTRAVQRWAERAASTGPTSRAQRLAEDVALWLDQILGDPLFKQVGPLRRPPIGNQVLLRAAGYRDLYRTAALVEAGLSMALPEDLDPFGASQRSIATLYEYWCFVQLARAVGEATGDVSPIHDLFKATGDEMSLVLRAGQESALTWKVIRLDRQLVITLFFNRTFAAHGSAPAAWSRAMRPDCSMRVEATDEVGRSAGEIWLHFDAKYRIERLKLDVTEPVTGDDAAEEAASSTTSSRREDLLKMHAYRDAIRRSAGAYVLYPGDAPPLTMREYHEILPGLGAFALRPTTSGESGRGHLVLFVNDALDHFAAQVTQHERARYWNERIHAIAPQGALSSRFTPLIQSPPEDVDVLLGFVRSDDQERWVLARQQYNLRGDTRPGAVKPQGRELAAPFLLLYRLDPDPRVLGLFRCSGEWVSVDAGELRAIGYPDPQGDAYFVTSFEEVDQPAWVPNTDVSRLLPPEHRHGAPAVRAWTDLLSCVRVADEG